MGARVEKFLEVILASKLGGTGSQGIPRVGLLVLARLLEIQNLNLIDV